MSRSSCFQPPCTARQISGDFGCGAKFAEGSREIRGHIFVEVDTFGATGFPGMFRSRHITAIETQTLAASTGPISGTVSKNLLFADLEAVVLAGQLTESPMTLGEDTTLAGKSDV